MKYVTLDIETTGLPPQGADYERDYMFYPYIVSMAWQINDLSPVEYIINNLGVSIPPETTAIHGITQEMADKSQWSLFSVMIQFIMDAHGADISIGHNIFFDTSIFKANILRLIYRNGTSKQFYDEISLILRSDRRVDTCRASMSLGKGKKLKLTELYFLLFNERLDGAHSASTDVKATYRCFQELCKRGLIKVNV